MGSGVKTPSNLRGSRHSEPMTSATAHDVRNMPMAETEFSLDVNSTSHGNSSLVGNGGSNMTAIESDFDLNVNKTNITSGGNSTGKKLKRRRGRICGWICRSHIVHRR